MLRQLEERSRRMVECLKVFKKYFNFIIQQESLLQSNID